MVAWRILVGALDPRKVVKPLTTACASDALGAGPGRQPPCLVSVAVGLARARIARNERKRRNAKFLAAIKRVVPPTPSPPFWAVGPYLGRLRKPPMFDQPIRSESPVFVGPELENRGERLEFFSGIESSIFILWKPNKWGGGSS